MSRRKVALLMTVGGEVNGKNADRYARSLLISITNYNPDLIDLIGSENSKKTLESLEKQYYDEYGENIEYIFKEVNEIDSFDTYFSAFEEEIFKLNKEKYDTRIDYTLGTKTMTMSAALASALYHKKLCFVKGKRGEKGIIQGTEEAKNVNLYKFYDKTLLEKIYDLFNTNRFDSASVLLNDVVSQDIDKKVYNQFLMSYSYFDKVNHEEAYKNFNRKDFVSEFQELEDIITANYKALNIINSPSHGLKDYYILASILNNARRRALENKFDDAIARLYRSLELICQIRLKDYDLESSDIDISKLGDIDEEFLDELKSKGEVIKLGLVDDFRLLYYLGDDLGKYYMDNSKVILNIITYRNSSILAHGLQYSSKENFDAFNDIVLSAANILTDNIDRYIEETKFPVFK